MSPLQSTQRYMKGSFMMTTDDHRNDADEEKLEADAKLKFGLSNCVLVHKLSGGMAGSQVWLVNYSRIEEPALKIGVLKVVPTNLLKDYDREMIGSTLACDSWLEEFAAEPPEGRELDGPRLMLTQLALPANRTQVNVSLHEMLAHNPSDPQCQNAVKYVAGKYADRIIEYLNQESWEGQPVSGIVSDLLERWKKDILKLDWSWWWYPGMREPHFLDTGKLRTNPLWAAFEPTAWRQQNSFMPKGFQHCDLNCRNVLVLESADSSGSASDVRFIDWEKAGVEKASEASLYLDLCWLSAWSLMAIAEGRKISIDSPDWEKIPLMFVNRALNLGAVPHADAFAGAVGTLDAIWGTLWRKVDETHANSQAIRAQLAMTLGAACLAKAFYEVRDLDKLRKDGSRWKPLAPRWAACFFRIAAIAWEESHLLATHAGPKTSNTFDINALPVDESLGVIERVFKGTWSPQDIENLARQINDRGKGCELHPLAKAAGEYLDRSLEKTMERNPPQVLALLNHLWQLVNTNKRKISTYDSTVQWIGHVIPLDALEKYGGVGPADLLMLIVCRLKQANHRGLGTKEFPDSARLEALRRNRGFKQDLLLEADTAWAVTLSNEFRFQEATEYLRHHWPDITTLEAIPGLELEVGRLESSLGQYEAFVGRHAEADSYFRSALAMFERAGQARGDLATDIGKTTTYRAINLLDWDSDQADPVIDGLYRKNPSIGVGLAEAGGRFINNLADPFLHHLFLRRAWLGDGLAKDYLKDWREWQHGKDHPWELIDLYRGLLLRREPPKDPPEQRSEDWVAALREECRRCFERAAELSLNGSSVLAVIGMVIAAIARCAGVMSDGAITERALGRAVLEQRRQRMNFDFAAVIDALSNPAEERIEGLLKLLPFNYR